MLKKLILMLLVVAPLSVFAQEKTAYINVQEIFSKIPEFEQVQVKLKSQSETIKKNADAIETEYTALYEKFAQSKDEPTPALIADRSKQLEQIKERYEQYMEGSKMELEQAQEKMLAPIREKMQGAIKEVGDENNYTYIADVAVFMYISPSAIDANKQVKAKLGITN